MRLIMMGLGRATPPSDSRHRTAIGPKGIGPKANYHFTCIGLLPPLRLLLPRLAAGARRRAGGGNVIGTSRASGPFQQVFGTPEQDAALFGGYDVSLSVRFPGKTTLLSLGAERASGDARGSLILFNAELGRLGLALAPALFLRRKGGSGGTGPGGGPRDICDRQNKG
jgi:hypothetical protein